MSEEIDTLEENVKINSFCSGEKYFLRIIDKNKKQNGQSHFLFTILDQDKELNVREYGDLLKDLWVNYLEKGERPSLLGHKLSDDGFINETMHYLMPGPKRDDSGPVLSEDRSKLIYWLLLQNTGKIFDREDHIYFVMSINSILEENIKRKRIQDKN
jgi:hypothetical protein